MQNDPATDPHCCKTSQAKTNIASDAWINAYLAFRALPNTVFATLPVEQAPTAFSEQRSIATSIPDIEIPPDVPLELRLDDAAPRLPKTLLRCMLDGVNMIHSKHTKETVNKRTNLARDALSVSLQKTPLFTVSPWPQDV